MAFLRAYSPPDVNSDSPALAIIEAERAAGVEVYALDRTLLDRATAASGVLGESQSSDGRGIDHATQNLARSSRSSAI